MAKCAKTLPFEPPPLFQNQKIIFFNVFTSNIHDGLYECICDMVQSQIGELPANVLDGIAILGLHRSTQAGNQIRPIVVG